MMLSAGGAALDQQAVLCQRIAQWFGIRYVVGEQRCSLELVLDDAVLVSAADRT